ncbi:GntR family transcriptional regulator [Brevundimonas sp.]|uniref:GntR family transcriptional regulator n=2 Tax=Brevundimonas sp. TaxID=1871086 RepID=UPI00391BF5B4
MASPRYRQLAETLRAAIARGDFPVGSQLPPELELAQTHGVSRHTARDAIRLLTEAGLIARRRGAGTTVIAASSPQAYVQPLGGVEDLMQYAQTARLTVLAQVERPLTSEEAARIGGDLARVGLGIDGLRIAESLPLALSRIYVPQPFTSVAGVLGEGRSVHVLLDERFGVAAGRIDQEITAELLSAVDARTLKAETGGAALRTLRRYFAEDDTLILASDSVHPGARFVYAMTYRREG